MCENFSYFMKYRPYIACLMNPLPTSSTFKLAFIDVSKILSKDVSSRCFIDLRLYADANFILEILLSYLVE